MRVPQSAEVEEEALFRIDTLLGEACFNGDLELADFWTVRRNQQEAEWIAALGRELSIEGGE